MNAIIEHESRSRIRIRLLQNHLTCAQADLLQTWLQQLDGVQRARVNERTRCLIIYGRHHRNKILNAIKQLTWQSLQQSATAPTHSTRALTRRFEEQLVGRVITKLLCTLLMPLPLRIARVLWHAAALIRKGVRCLLAREMKVELLDAISISISLLRKDFATVDSVLFLMSIGELLEDWIRKKSVQDLAQCMSLNIDRVWLRTPQGEVLAPITQIQPGDCIVVRTGGIIPLDGIITEGEAMVNQASLTGESVPAAKHHGSLVYAGTVVEEGECIIEVQQTSGQSRYEQIAAIIEQSEQLKSIAESKASGLADRLVPYTFGGSLLVLALTGSFTRALSVLMVDFSCALKLAMPLAVMSAMREAGQQHITVKGGKFLEVIALADTIVFDKTGTLTHACPQVACVIPFQDYDENEILRLAACLEEHFPHSMANAVVEEAKQRGLNHEECHSKVEYLVAHGIASQIGEKRVLIGSAHFIFEDEGCKVHEYDQDKFHQLPTQYSHLYVAIEQQLAAVICISDPLRKEAPEVLRTLKAMGIQHAVMLTGDSQRTAATIAAEVGVDKFYSGVLPADKANYVAKLRQQGHTVIMIGDGINDSPALSEADAGIAIHDGAAIAQEISDITIPAQSLWELVHLRHISCALMRRIHTNYRFVLGFNSALIALGTAGLILPTTSAMLHNLSTLGISLASMTPLPNQTFPSCSLTQRST